MRFASNKLLSTLLGLLLIATAALSLWKPDATFSIDARTQILTWTPGERGIPRWQFRSARMYRGDEPEPIDFSGNVELTPNAIVTLTRLGDGPLRVTVEPTDSSSPVLNIYGLDEEWIDAVYEPSVFVMDINTAEDAIMLLMTGQLDIGQEFGQYGSESPELLKSAKVSILGHTIDGRSLYDGGSTELDAGDYVRFGVNSNAVGQVIVDTEPGLAIIARVIADNVEVRRYSSQGYEIQSSLFSRLKNDNVLQALWASLLFLGGVRRYLLAKLSN